MGELTQDPIVKKYLETKVKTYQSLEGVTKVVLKETLIVINTYLKKKKIYINITLQLKELEKGKQRS